MKLTKIQEIEQKKIENYNKILKENQEEKMKLLTIINNPFNTDNTNAILKYKNIIEYEKTIKHIIEQKQNSILAQQKETKKFRFLLIYIASFFIVLIYIFIWLYG